MGRDIASVLTFAVAVAISPVPIIAVILMLFSRRARVNGPVFLLGWVLALAVVSTVVYVLAHASHPATSSAASDTISWGKIVLGGFLLLLALHSWRNRPRPGTEPAMPRWMSGVDALTPAKALGLAVLLAGVNPKNLVLTAGAAAGLAQLEPSTAGAVVALIVFVVLASVTIAGPVLYHRLGGDKAKAHLDELEGWLRVHNAAVMTVLLLVLGADLIAKGIPPLTA